MSQEVPLVYVALDNILNKHKDQVNNIIHVKKPFSLFTPIYDDFYYVKYDILIKSCLFDDSFIKTDKELAIAFKKGIEKLYSIFEYKPIARIIYGEVKFLLQHFNIDLSNNYFDDDPHYIEYDESLFYD